MTSQPKPGIAADTNAGLDTLTKEEKEALLTKKMDMIRQSNKALSERHKLIEADKKRAEEAGQAVKPSLQSQLLPAEGGPRPRGRGRGLPFQRDGNRPARDRANPPGDLRDTSQHESLEDAEDTANYRGKGRGESHDREAPNQMHKSKRRPTPDEDVSSTFPIDYEYEPIVDITDLDKRFRPLHSASEGRSQPYNHNQDDSPGQQPYRRRNDSDGPSADSGRAYRGRLKDNEGPPPDPSFNPLADRRRSDNKDDFPDQKRHPRNYGGSVELSKVKQSMKTTREKERELHPGNKPLMMVMTGKERKNHEDWKAERERYDQERIQRQLSGAGSWKREWDADKTSTENDEQPSSHPHQRTEHARQSDQQSEHSGQQQQRYSHNQQQQERYSNNQQQQERYSHNQQQQERYSHNQHQSQDLSPQLQEIRSPRGRGRGRGNLGKPGKQLPHPRNHPEGDNRFVECQKEHLLVKIGNTARDSTVDVKYDDQEFPALKSTSPKSSDTPTIPKRGPTTNHDSKQQSNDDKQSSKRNKRLDNKNESKAAPMKPSTGVKSYAAITTQIIPDPAAVNHNTDEAAAPVASNSRGSEDSDQWEDCSGSSEAGQEGEPIPADNVVSETKEKDTGHNLHLECPSDPVDVSFMPTSPDFMKTPPGHVKVLDWAAEGCPTSPLSQDSAVSPHPLSQGSSIKQSPRS